MDKYASYTQLEREELEDRDYTILYRDLASKIVIMAPHGGGIEPGTIDVADEVAGADYTFYGFKALKPAGNSSLHITSNQFDEPLALKAALGAEVVVTIHGARDKVEVVYVGGLNTGLKQIAITTLTAAGFRAEASTRPGLRGIKPENICNKCRTKQGVQLELSRGLREALFENLPHRSLRRKRVKFYQFVNALKTALKQMEMHMETGAS